jgi:Protein of unknown function (DUF1579)
MSRWLFASALLVLVPGAWTQESTKRVPSPDEIMKAMAEAVKPGPEHKKLEPLVGSWSFTCKMWMDPTKAPMESKGTIERQWILGGRFVEEKVTGTSFDGKPGFEGRGILGYDNAQKKYTMGWICSMSTGIENGVGTADTSGKNFTFQTECFCPVRKTKIHGKNVLRIASSDRNVMEMFEIEGGKEQKMMEIVCVRTK